MLYVPYHAKGDIGHEDVERGVVTSVNSSTVFARFGDSLHSAACNPDTLVYEHPHSSFNTTKEKT